MQEKFELNESSLSVSYLEKDTTKIYKYNVTINDTFFIRRVTANGYYHVVFIDTNRNNWFYNEIQKIDTIDISSIYEEFKSPLKKVDTKGFPDRWIQLVMYKGQFFVDKPNDWYLLNRFTINDSLYIRCYSDPYINEITSFNKVGNNYRLVKKEYDYNIKKFIPSTLNIYPYDKKRKIFIFENVFDNDTSFIFATPIDNVFNFDLIISIFNQGKHFGISYDNVNYKKLLNSR